MFLCIFHFGGFWKGGGHGMTENKSVGWHTYHHYEIVVAQFELEKVKVQMLRPVHCPGESLAAAAACSQWRQPHTVPQCDCEWTDTGSRFHRPRLTRTGRLPRSPAVQVTPVTAPARSE